MKKKKTWVALGICILALFTATACGNKNSEPEAETADMEKSSATLGQTPDEESGEVILEWWYAGNGSQPDSQKVEDAFNELLKTYPGMENVTVNLNCYPTSEYANAVVLAQSAGKQMDLVNTVCLDFANEISNGTFLQLDDMLAENSALKNELPDWIWKMGGIDGKTYIVPSYQRAANVMYFVTPKEYMDQYGDIDAMRAVLQDPDHTPEELAAVFEEYCLAVRAGTGIDTKYMPPIARQWYSVNSGMNNKFDTIVGNFIMEEGTGTVEHSLMTEDMKSLLKIDAEWYEKGYIHPDILTITEGDFKGQNALNEVSYIFQFTNGMGDEERQSKLLSSSIGFDFYVIPITLTNFIQGSYAAGGTGITVKCEHPDKALRLLELMTTEEGTALYNMVVYGLEDVHYKKIDDTHIETLEYSGTQGGIDTSYAAWKWVMGNTFHAYLNQGCTDDENELSLAINEDPNNTYSELMGFAANTEKIQTQLEQCAAVYSEYEKQLTMGVMGADWEATYDEFIAKMNSAGLQDVLTELQIQVDNYTSK